MASSYSCPVQPRYQVFMSFRGEDTRHSFTSHLLKALKEHGIRVFFDEETLEKGEELTPALLNAIAASNISIVVLSEDYASSKSCLGELSKIMECKLSQAQIVLPIFYRVNPSHVRHPNQDESPFKESFHQHLMNKPEEAERWKAAFTQVGYLKGWHMDGGNSDRDDMVHIDMNYKQASFDFKVACNYYDDKLRYLKGEERKVEKCGVHVFYVDAESFTVSEATGSSINFSSEEGNTSCSPSIISPNSASPILHSVARLTIEEDANVGNGHGLKALLLQYLET
ncbi:hypothetical protein COLO4_08785 [Corchorus olitorius]|uniref:ADP-ribosyl cyclase/cyclic ADP-ribose hydrolase n=1 Tax=Corchorus olitorius TaxID=93759 RepID=A0A1R3KEQ5_9ROSI|nr:hypothetical protein COLO4_08785 [Corchorus olitorius]